MASNNPIIPFAIGTLVGSALATILLSDKPSPLKDKLKDATLALLDTAEQALQQDRSE